MSKEANFVHPNGALYCNLMAQLRQRTEVAISNAASPVSSTENPIFVIEYCMLQARYCCELSALGCVAMHVDKPEVHKLEKYYHATEVMKEFEKIKPKFFPQPMFETMRSDGVIQYGPVDGSLTKQELLDIYGKSGNFLHIGSLKRFRKNPSHDYTTTQLDTFFTKLIKLLNVHHYILNDEKHMIRVLMNDKITGKVVLQQLVRGKPPH